MSLANTNRLYPSKSRMERYSRKLYHYFTEVYEAQNYIDPWYTDEEPMKDGKYSNIHHKDLILTMGDMIFLKL